MLIDDARALFDMQFSVLFGCAHNAWERAKINALPRIMICIAGMCIIGMYTVLQADNTLIVGLKCKPRLGRTLPTVPSMNLKTRYRQYCTMQLYFMLVVIGVHCGGM